MNDNLKSVMTGTKALIASGAPTPAIKDWLRLHGVEERDTDMLIADCMREHKSQTQRVGLRNFLLGGLLIMIGTLSVAAMAFARIFIPSIIAPAVLALMIGSWQISTGLSKVLGRERRKS